MYNKSIDSLIKEYWATLDEMDFRDHDWFVFRINDMHHIVVDCKLDIQHRRFAIWHELWHIKDNSVWYSDKYSEQRASNISVQLLISDNDIQDAIESWYSDIPTLCTIFWVPYHWMEKRLKKFFKLD